MSEVGKRVSVEAITWVLNEAQDVPAPLVSTLVGLANHATPDGRNAYPSQAKLAKYTRKSERTVRRDLAELERLGLICRGDQRVVEHVPRDRRPVVYDLCMAPSDDDPDGRTPTTPRTRTTGRGRPGVDVSSGHTRPGADDRGDAHDRSSMAERGDAHVRTGGTPTSAKPSEEPSRTKRVTVVGQVTGSQSVHDAAEDRKGAAWLRHRYGRLTDRGIAELLTEARRRALTAGRPVRHMVKYLESWDEGELADLAAAVMDREDAREHLATQPRLQAVPDWCGHCDRRTRMLDPDRPRRCPACNPNVHQQAS